MHYRQTLKFVDSRQPFPPLRAFRDFEKMLAFRVIEIFANLVTLA